MADGQAAFPRIGLKDRVRGLAFSPDARNLLARLDNEVRIFEVATGREAAPLLRFLGLRSATFSPDGRLVLTTAQGCARFSDWRTARPVTDALAVTFDATITPDGRGLLRDQYSVCQIMTLPLAETAPAWLPELDECVYLQSLRGDGIFEALPATAWLALRSCLAALPRQGFVERIRTLVRRRSVGAPADARQREFDEGFSRKATSRAVGDHERDRPGGTLSCACCGRANPKVGQCATAPIVSAQTHCGKLPHNVISFRPIGRYPRRSWRFLP